MDNYYLESREKHIFTMLKRKTITGTAEKLGVDVDDFKKWLDEKNRKDINLSNFYYRMNAEDFAWIVNTSVDNAKRLYRNFEIKTGANNG